jgi:plastocyanin
LLPIATSTPAPRATATGTVNPYIATALPATITVTMKNLQFQPASLQVTANTTVTWMNTETTNTQHFIVSGSCVNNVCTPTNQFASDILAPGQSFSLRFTYIGTYSYYCVIHGSRMTGTIMVTP